MSEQNRAIGYRWFEEIWNQRRTETIDELMHPDAIGHMEGVEPRGPEEFKKVRAGLLDAFPDIRVVVEAVVADENQVAVRWRAEGKHTGAGLGFAASGRPAAFRGMSWIRIADGKLVEGWDAWNQGKLFAELSAASKPTPRASKKKPLRSKTTRPANIRVNSRKKSATKLAKRKSARR